MKNIIKSGIIGMVMCLSQESALCQYIDGSVISSENDTLEVQLTIPKGKWWNGTSTLDIDYGMLQQGVSYLDKNNNKQQVKPNKYKAFLFDHDGKQIIMVAKKRDRFTGEAINRLVVSYIFLKQEVEGELNLYKYYYKKQNTTYNPATGVTTANNVPVTYEKVLVEKNGEMLMNRYNY